MSTEDGLDRIAEALHEIANKLDEHDLSMLINAIDDISKAFNTLVEYIVTNDWKDYGEGAWGFVKGFLVSIILEGGPSS